MGHPLLLWRLVVTSLAPKWESKEEKHAERLVRPKESIPLVRLLQSRSLSFYLLLLSIHPSIPAAFGSLLSFRRRIVVRVAAGGQESDLWHAPRQSKHPIVATHGILLRNLCCSHRRLLLVLVRLRRPPLPIAKENMRDSRSPLFFWCLVFFSLSHHGKLLHLPCPLPSYPLFGWLKAIASPSFDRSGLLICYKQLTFFFVFGFDCITCSVKSSWFRHSLKPLINTCWILPCHFPLYKTIIRSSFSCSSPLLYIPFHTFYYSDLGYCSFIWYHS